MRKWNLIGRAWQAAREIIDMRRGEHFLRDMADIIIGGTSVRTGLEKLAVTSSRLVRRKIKAQLAVMPASTPSDALAAEGYRWPDTGTISMLRKPE